MQEQKRIAQEIIDHIREAKDFIKDFRDVLRYFAPYLIFETLRNNPSIGDDLFAASLEVIFQLCLKEFANSNIEPSMLFTYVQEAIEKSPEVAIEKLERIADKIARFSLFNGSKSTNEAMGVANNNHDSDITRDQIRSKI
jgi:hypothetical protein